MFQETVKKMICINHSYWVSGELKIKDMGCCLKHETVTVLQDFVA
jgi:hypothetical protein